MIVRDGWPFILIALALTLLFVFGAVRWNNMPLLIVAALFALLTLFTTFFFRNPDRTIPTDPNTLVSPADGKIVDIRSFDTHDYIGGPVTRVSIFLSVFDVHVNRVPASGTIDYVKYNPGKFFAAFEDKASELNEQNEIGMTTRDGHRITFSQIAGIIARRIVCDLEEGQEVTVGKRYGLIRFGSRTDITVPSGWEIEVEKGQHVAGGESIIARIPRADEVKPRPQNVTENDGDS